MKMTIVLLVVLGIVAAVCAVVLVTLLPGLTTDSTKDEVSVLVATQSIPAYKDLTKEDLQVGTIDLTQEVGDYRNRNMYLTDPINAVGKTVSSDIADGQPITRDKIITDPDTATMLKALKPGMRAVAVRLSGDQITGGLLYPGCFVDVLAQFSTRSGSGKARGEAVSKTFLEKVKVIAVKGEMASDNKSEGEKTGSQVVSQGGWTVTLVVATDQVESLQLATDKGSISLTLRNPLDDIPVNSKGTVLDPSKISVFSDFFAPPPNKDQYAVPGFGNEVGFPKQKIEVIRGDKTTQEVVMSSQSQTDQKKE